MAAMQQQQQILQAPHEPEIVNRETRQQVSEPNGNFLIFITFTNADKL